MSFTAAVDHLHALGLELAPSPDPSIPRRKFDLEHMRILAHALGDPQKKFPAILIAGTNGKGSTAASLASILAAAGYRNGLYTSPHLSRVTERIRTAEPLPANPPLSFPNQAEESASPHSGQPTSFLEIPEDAFARLYFRVDEVAQTLVDAGQLPHHPSFFESLTALAFLYFAERSLDIAILEVGLGGRLDATNIVDPILSVITDIALDHQDYLGNTITEIAREKAGILRPNGILITLPQHPEANQAIGEIAIALNVRGINAANYLPARSAMSPPPRNPGAPSMTTPGAPFMTQPGAPFMTNPGASSMTTPGAPSMTKPGAPFMTQPHRGMSGVSTSAGRDSAPQVTAESSLETTPSKAIANSALLSGTASAVPLISPERGGALALEPTTPLTPNHYDLILDNELLQIRSPLAGQHQQRNIALAIAAAVELRNQESYKISRANLDSAYTIPNSTIEAGIAHTSWPGRLEFLPPNLILDVAHNPAGAWTLRAAIATLPERQPRTLIFSCLRDKDLTEMAQILFPLFDSDVPPRPDTPLHHIILTPINNPRAASLDDLLAAARALDIPAHPAHDPAEALALARSLTSSDGLILATGSIYLIGAIREAILNS